MFKLKLKRGRSEPRTVSIRPELARRFHAGEVEAFSEIYETFKAPLFGFLLRRMESANAAEDLSHDVFIKILKARELYDPSQEFAPWFWTVSRNTLNDHLRRRMNVAPSVSVDSPEAEEQGVPALVSTADIETMVLRHSDRTVLLKFLDRLTHLQREALSLRMVQKLSYNEIAKRMSLSLSAVKSLIHRAQGTLKVAFRKEHKRELRMVELQES